jgi:DNA-binding transcriptional LysR family regulator
MRSALGHLGESDIRLLRVFVVVAEAGGLAKAQSILNLNLSTISGYLSQLELRLGTSLCQRGRRGFQLTDEGKVVYAASRSLLAAHEDFRTAVGGIHGDLIGELRIGVVDNIVFDGVLRFEEVIWNFQKRHSRVLLRLFTLPPNHLESAILEGAVHIGIGQYFRELPGIVYEDLHSDPLMLYCARRHPLFERAPNDVTLDELEGVRFANRGYIDSGRLSESHPKFQITSVGYSAEAILILILSGMFVSYLPGNYATHWVEKGLLRPILPQALTVEAKISIAVPKVAKVPPAVRAFIAEIKAHREANASAHHDDHRAGPAVQA